MRNKIEALEKRNRDLEVAVFNLENARQAAEAANRAKSDFLANMGHELRTPLNHIIGFTELVVDKNLGDLNAAQEEYLNDSLNSGRRLLALINDILDLSKIEAGKMKLEIVGVPIKPILMNTLVMVREKAMKNGVEISSVIGDLPDTVYVDEIKMKRIIYNLLSTAIEFTARGGRVLLSAKMVPLEKSAVLTADGRVIGLDVSPRAKGAPDRTCLKVCVSDTGIGLEPDDLESVFYPFGQLKTTQGEKGRGAGLGLSLCRELVELHGGRIWAENCGGETGGRFCFVLPVGDHWPPRPRPPGSVTSKSPLHGSI